MKQYRIRINKKSVRKMEAANTERRKRDVNSLGLFLGEASKLELA